MNSNKMSSARRRSFSLRYCRRQFGLRWFRTDYISTVKTAKRPFE